MWRYRDGVSRVDLRARTATQVAAENLVSLPLISSGSGGAGQALIAIRVDADGTRRIVRSRPSAPADARSARRQRRSTARFSPWAARRGSPFPGTSLSIMVNR